MWSSVPFALGTTERQERNMPNQPTSGPGETTSSEWTAYRPNPPQETRLTIDSFLDTLVATEPDDPGLGQRVHNRHRDLINGPAGELVDEQSWMNLKMVLGLLAAYQELSTRWRRGAPTPTAEGLRRTSPPVRGPGNRLHIGWSR